MNLYCVWLELISQERRCALCQCCTTRWDYLAIHLPLATHLVSIAGGDKGDPYAGCRLHLELLQKLSLCPEDWEIKHPICNRTICLMSQALPAHHLLTSRSLSYSSLLLHCHKLQHSLHMSQQVSILHKPNSHTMSTCVEPHELQARFSSVQRVVFKNSLQPLQLLFLQIKL